MAKYARKIGPHWVDVYSVPGDYPDLATLDKCLPGGGFVAVDSGLIHGAAHNDGDGSAGTYTNPIPPAPPPHVPAPIIRTREDIIEALPGGVMKACRDSTDAAVIKQFYKFLAKGGFTKNEGIALAAFLQSKSIITQQQNDDFVAEWPEA